MITDDVKDVKKVLDELGIKPQDLKSIKIKYKKVFENKAFPILKITLKNNQDDTGKTSIE